MNFRIASFLMLSILSSCYSIEEYEAMLLGSWEGYVQGGGWCITYFEDGTFNHVLMEVKTDTQTLAKTKKITHETGYWMVDRGGRLKNSTIKKVEPERLANRWYLIDSISDSAFSYTSQQTELMFENKRVATCEGWGEQD